ncbi:MAG: hypothetical protein AB7P12_16850 [Alphaproteobacteria bacterium]
MYDFVIRSFQLDTANWFLLCAMVFAAAWIIHSLLDDYLVTAFTAPVLIFFAAVGRNLFIEFGIQVHEDKMLTGGFGFGAGIFAFSLLTALMFWTRRALANR